MPCFIPQMLHISGQIIHLGKGLLDGLEAMKKTPQDKFALLWKLDFRMLS